jgi:hypothetical protein
LPISLPPSPVPRSLYEEQPLISNTIPRESMYFIDTSMSRVELMPDAFRPVVALAAKEGW